MRVLVTGASGWVGTPVTQDLLRNGHEVIGLARSDKASAAIEALGAKVVRGDLDNLESLRKAASNVDGVLHLAFNHDFSKFAQSTQNDGRVIRAMAEALGAKPMVITSGTAIISGVGVADESIAVQRTSHNPRIASEIAMEEMNESGANVSVVRLPPSVHGEGDYGFVPMLIKIAREKNKAGYLGTGLNSWSGVSRFDAAPVYRLALERGVAGARYHAVDEGSILFKDIARTIASGLDVPLISLTNEEADEYYGWFKHFATMDIRVSSEWTRQTLNWKPTHASLLEDMKTYF